MKICSKCGLEKSLSDFSKSNLGAQGVRADCRVCVQRYDAARWARKANYGRALAYVKRLFWPEIHRVHSRNWRKRHPEKWTALVVAREAAKIRAMPKWADRELIAAFYAEARRLTQATGVLHHVDHIVPLRSKVVCGLHCQFNLRVITAKENERKHNTLLSEFEQSTKRAEMTLR